MEYDYEDRPTRPGRGTIVWIVMIAGIVLLSGFIPIVLAGRAQPLENMFHNCVEGESGIHINDTVQIEYANGIPIAVTYAGAVPGDVEQLCFDLIVRTVQYG